MSTFVQAYGNKQRGYPLLNLAHVAELRPVVEDGRTTAYDAISPTGERLGRISAHNAPETDAMGATIVPNMSEVTALLFWRDDDGKIQVDRYPVVAWRCRGDEHGGWADPITPDRLCDPWCLECSMAGSPYRWILPQDCELASLEDARDWADKALKLQEEVRRLNVA